MARPGEAVRHRAAVRLSVALRLCKRSGQKGSQRLVRSSEVVIACYEKPAQAGFLLGCDVQPTQLNGIERTIGRCGCRCSPRNRLGRRARPMSRISPKVILVGPLDMPHDCADRGESEAATGDKPHVVGRASPGDKPHVIGHNWPSATMRAMPFAARRGTHWCVLVARACQPNKRMGALLRLSDNPSRPPASNLLWSLHTPDGEWAVTRPMLILENCWDVCAGTLSDGQTRTVVPRVRSLLVHNHEGRDAVIVAPLVRLKCIDANLLAEFCLARRNGDVWPIATRGHAHARSRTIGGARQ
jgi:hypothetical protein